MAETPVGTTKELDTVLAKTAESAVKLVPMAVPVTVLQIVMLPILSHQIFSFKGPMAPTWRAKPLANVFRTAIPTPVLINAS